MIKLCLMENAHVSQVAALENVCFSDPWSENAFISELSNPLSTWIVAIEDDRVVGYVGCQSVLDSADIMNIAVDINYRRQGIAEQLMLDLIDRLSKQGINILLLEVRLSNVSAQALYNKLGFVHVGTRPNYYFKPREDALIYRKEW